MSKPLCFMLCTVAGSVLQTGCSIFSPVPVFELVKATGIAASTVIAVGPSTAKNTVYHIHPTFNKVCIEFNPESQAVEILPALQSELRLHQIESRIYEPGTGTNICEVWLNYAAYIEWAIPPYTNDYKTYLTTATLTLRNSSGKVLSRSTYELDPTYGMGKWSSTRSKIAPVVNALVTGFES
ncbi:cell division protein FtsI [Rhodoferax sp.]|uniref:cell division protein FtsI n=1 Tax=Rhodoferax sp. TaxID=50421 RepID=UPI00374D3B98